MYCICCRHRNGIYKFYDICTKMYCAILILRNYAHRALSPPSEPINYFYYFYEVNFRDISAIEEGDRRQPHFGMTLRLSIVRCLFTLWRWCQPSIHSNADDLQIKSNAKVYGNQTRFSRCWFVFANNAWLTVSPLAFMAMSVCVMASFGWPSIPLHLSSHFFLLRKGNRLASPNALFYFKEWHDFPP